mmetsp:Transcript_6614/g.11094  ORF Transcript_6614/g.11094 Transcript_6614/m.11094 type:complete len:119 (+) Transcript_6614:17-373(+)|eukprot:CAMPEP_0174965062 /NCGR_PEP_ID=MMETSP0004_2-20121128/6233_1 /TAXON_ID=420556 /ORGANISM="Ochromonas sp., Strain CCMP1393" /LENGTH=118 /DNA_ID=CAMNT_0016213869 /DNA_START=12 /DNA_END=368 /DNA_ORIENTATION=+
MDFDKVKLLIIDPTFLATVIVVLLAIIVFRGSDGAAGSGSTKPAVTTQVNSKIKKGDAKVVDFVECCEIENLAQYKDGKVVMCRCWKSDTFPYCDGSHVQHNKENGDNVGPLIIKKEK